MDGSITVVALCREESSSFIRNGVPYKIDKTAQCISSIVNKLKMQLKVNINRVYVGIGGQSIHSERNVNVRDLPNVEMITQRMIDDIQETNRQMNYPGQYILDSITQEYKVDNLLQNDPVGIQCRHLESNFLNILCREQFYNNLNECFEIAGIPIAEMILSPVALADSVLADSEKRSGCVLVDLGADTTTVAVYHKNILRHLAVIPLGGSNITRDIASQHIEEDMAEDMKLRYGTAYSDFIDTNDAVQYNAGEDKQISNILFNDIVESRLREIIENINCQIPKTYRDSLLGGLIITGGGCNMPNIEKAFVTYTGIQKVRIAKFVQQTINSHIEELSARNGMMNGALSILAKGEMCCTGEEFHQNEELFTQQGEAAVDVSSPVVIDVSPQPKRQGVVITPVEIEAIEKRRAEEAAQAEAEARAKAEAEAEKAKALAEEEAKRMADTGNKPSVGKRLKNWFRNFMSEE